MWPFPYLSGAVVAFHHEKMASPTQLQNSTQSMGDKAYSRGVGLIKEEKESLFEPITN